MHWMNITQAEICFSKLFSCCSLIQKWHTDHNNDILAMLWNLFFFHSHWINNCSKSKVKILKQHPAWGLQLFKETLIQVPSCEFCNTFKNTFFKEYLRWVLLYLYCRLEWTFVIFGKSFILDVWHGSEYASEWDLKQEEKGKLFSRLETMLSIRLFFSLILGRICL